VRCREEEWQIGSWTTLCPTSRVLPGEAEIFQAGDREIALFNIEGEFHAIDNHCTHEGGPLGEGMIFGSTVSCPWHFAEFDVTTGESLDEIAPCDVETYAVRVVEGEVQVEVP